MRFTIAVKWLVLMGCDPDYSSDAVDTEHQTLESVIHELAHASVCKLPLQYDPKPLKAGKYDRDGLTQRLGSRIGSMPDWAKDRNEETTLAVGMLVLGALGITYRKSKFISGADWKTKRPHRVFIDQALTRLTTRRHAQRILNYLRYLNGKPPPPYLDVRTASEYLRLA